MEDVKLKCADKSLFAGLRIQLAPCITDVKLHRYGPQSETVGNLVIAKTATQPQQAFSLAFRQANRLALRLVHQ